MEQLQTVAQLVIAVLLAALVYRAYSTQQNSGNQTALTESIEAAGKQLRATFKAYTPIHSLEVGRRNVVAEKLASFCKPKETVEYALRHILQHGEVDPIQFCAAHLEIQGMETDLHEVIREGVALGLLKSTGQGVTVNQELKDALAFHLLGD